MFWIIPEHSKLICLPNLIDLRFRELSETDIRHFQTDRTVNLIRKKNLIQDPNLKNLFHQKNSKLVVNKSCKFIKSYVNSFSSRNSHTTNIKFHKVLLGGMKCSEWPNSSSEKWLNIWHSRCFTCKKLCLLCVGGLIRNYSFKYLLDSS